MRGRSTAVSAQGLRANEESRFPIFTFRLHQFFTRGDMGLVGQDLPYGGGERRYLPNLVLPINMIGLVQTRYGERLRRGVEPLVHFKTLRLQAVHTTTL